MNPEQNPLENLGEIRDEKDALDQSIALNRIVMTMLQHQKESNKRMFIALIISLIIFQKFFLEKRCILLLIY